MDIHQGKHVTDEDHDPDLYNDSMDKQQEKFDDNEDKNVVEYDYSNEGKDCQGSERDIQINDGIL